MALNGLTLACTTPRIASCTRVCETVLARSRLKTTLNQLTMVIKELSRILWLLREAFRSKAAAREGPLLWTSNPVEGAPRQGRLQRGLPGIGYSCRGKEVCLISRAGPSSFGWTRCALDHPIL